MLPGKPSPEPPHHNPGYPSLKRCGQCHIHHLPCFLKGVDGETKIRLCLGCCIREQTGLKTNINPALLTMAVGTAQGIGSVISLLTAWVCLFECLKQKPLVPVPAQGDEPTPNLLDGKGWYLFPLGTAWLPEKLRHFQAHQTWTLEQTRGTDTFPAALLPLRGANRQEQAVSEQGENSALNTTPQISLYSIKKKPKPNKNKQIKE